MVSERAWVCHLIVAKRIINVKTDDRELFNNWMKQKSTKKEFTCMRFISSLGIQSRAKRIFSM